MRLMKKTQKKNTGYFRFILLLTVLLLTACGKSGPPLDSRYNKEMVSAGGKLFTKNCAVCHGAKGQGNAKWRVRQADGNFPPPPLNGTGHAWHHPQKQLIGVVQNGTPRGMPAWKGKLTLEQTQSVLAWLQAKWPDRAYNAWLDINTTSARHH